MYDTVVLAKPFTNHEIERLKHGVAHTGKQQSVSVARARDGTEGSKADQTVVAAEVPEGILACLRPAHEQNLCCVCRTTP